MELEPATFIQPVSKQLILTANMIQDEALKISHLFKKTFHHKLLLHLQYATFTLFDCSMWSIHSPGKAIHIESVRLVY